MSESAGNASAGTAAVGGEGHAQASQQPASQTQAGQQTAENTNEAAAMPSVLNTTETGEDGDDNLSFHDYVRQQFPDEKFEDDDGVLKRAKKHIKELSDYRTKNKEANQKVNQMLHAHPELVDVLRDLDAGADMRVALARHFSAEDLAVEEGEPDYEAWKTANTERQKRFEEKRQWQESFAKNRKEAGEVFSQFATDNKMDQAKAQEFAEKTDAILTDVYNGKISRQFLDTMYKALMFDQAVKQANEVGKVAGRNEKIEAKIVKDQEQKGDGLPNLQKTGEMTETEMPEGFEMMGKLVDDFNSKRQRFGRKQ